MVTGVARDTNDRPYREIIRLVKYRDTEAYRRGEPEEVIERVVWYEADGSMIVDPARIAELEAQNGKE